MADEKSKLMKAAGGVVAAGIVAGAGIGIYQLRQWTKAMDKATEKGATDAEGAAPVPPELLTWKEVGRVRTGLASVRSFALLPDGTVVAAGEKKLRVMTAAGAGEVVRDIALADEPQAVAVDGKTVYVGMKDHVEVWDLAGKKLAQWEPLGKDAYITCVTVGAGGGGEEELVGGERGVADCDGARFDGQAAARDRAGGCGDARAGDCGAQSAFGCGSGGGRPDMDQQPGPA